ncbi:DUF1259 domain-containing protein [Streptomyces pinistramenti]|uniref:DUF1259 domain-containing protein n=1 Tax=Streptomyces pinistramenti TaxID=2884812 RepID=UPI001D08287C|nr:DUF1259 domain-containing protein [Streptomyces pinistramenti]MCB5906868.1 DUF1259 domain-containing protein [Streptomyces pinistramenti]
MMTGDGQQGTRTRAITSRRRLLAAAAVAPMLAGAGPGAAQALPAREAGAERWAVEPVRTGEADWEDVANALGRRGNMLRGTIYHTGFPRRDLYVISDGVLVTPGLALGTHVAFVRYADGSTMAMGDVVVTEDETQQVCDAWQAHGIEQTALHKHLLAQTPDLWWAHVHAHGDDPVALARGLRAGFDRTGTPPAGPPGRQGSVDLDVAGVEAALDVRGTTEDGLYKCLFVRRETIVDGRLVLPAGLGATCAFNFQPVGGGRVALSGDFAMVAEEVQDVLRLLRRGGIKLVELHNHHLTETPRLFFTHFWAVGDAVELARALRSAVEAANVAPAVNVVPAG